MCGWFFKGYLLLIRVSYSKLKKKFLYVNSFLVRFYHDLLSVSRVKLFLNSFRFNPHFKPLSVCVRFFFLLYNLWNKSRWRRQVKNINLMNYNILFESLNFGSRSRKSLCKFFDPVSPLCVFGNFQDVLVRKNFGHIWLKNINKDEIIWFKCEFRVEKSI